MAKKTKAPQVPSINNLTREEKLQLLQVLEEKARRKKLQVEAYVPNQGQLQVHKSTKKIRLVVSGNGAGKTTLGVNETVWAAQGFNPVSKQHLRVPRRVVVVLDKPDKVADKWIPEIKKWFDTSEWSFNKMGKPYVCQAVLPTGSEIKFMFHEQDELSFESLEVDDLIFDEPPPRHVYIALIRGMRNKDHKARILIIGTPITGAWLRKEIYEPWADGEAPDTDCFRFSTAVNEDNLPEGYVEWFGSKLSEKERKIRIEGEFFDLDGLALAHLFRREHHLVTKDKYDWDKSYPCVVALDPHPEKKHVAVLMGADKHGPVVLKELAMKSVPRDFAKHLKKWYTGYRVVDIVCDSLGSSAMTGGENFKSFIEILNEEGVRARATTFQEKDDTEWIARIQDALRIPDEPDNFGNRQAALRIMADCHGLINDIETVEWAKIKNMEDFKPKLDISRKDFLAALKYALATGLTYSRRKNAVYYRTDSVYGMQMPTAQKAKTGRISYKKSYTRF